MHCYNDLATAPPESDVHGLLVASAAATILLTNCRRLLF